jgi:hypothetical protein
MGEASRKVGLEGRKRGAMRKGEAGGRGSQPVRLVFLRSQTEFGDDGESSSSPWLGRREEEQS